MVRFVKVIIWIVEVNVWRALMYLVGGFRRRGFVDDQSEPGYYINKLYEERLPLIEKLLDIDEKIIDLIDVETISTGEIAPPHDTAALYRSKGLDIDLHYVLSVTRSREKE